MVVWLALGEPDQAVERTVTVLVIACPHALGLAIPLVIAISTALAARNGILVKDRLALERMRTVDAVLFDKTGTLTTGPPPGHRRRRRRRGPDDELLRLAGAVEADSEHPLARAIVAAAQAAGATAQGVRVPRHDRPRRPGHRRRRHVAVGGPALLRQLELAEPEALAGELDGWRGAGRAVLYVVRDDKVVGALSLEDEVRPESRQAVAELHRLGKRVVMITGDARQVAEAVGRRPRRRRGVRRGPPRGQGPAPSPTCRPAAWRWPWSATASTTPPPWPGPTSASPSAPAPTWPSSPPASSWPPTTPAASSAVIRLSRASYRKMLQNLAWAAGYNIVAIPLAAGAFAWAGLTLAPAVGAILMSVSTIVVALNAQLLRRLDLRPGQA